MEPSEGSHPDISSALQAAGQKFAELAALAALAGQVYAQVVAGKAGRAAGGLAEGEGRRGAVQAAWAPALHREWLSDAGLDDVARAWGAAVPCEHIDPSAAAAVRACEERLREIHPYAMSNYKQLRDQGQPRAEAMVNTVPLFALHPSPRPAPQDVYEGRYLTAGAPAAAWPEPPHADPGEAVIARMMAIIARLSEQSIVRGRGPLTPDVAAMELARLTNAPDALISQVTAGLANGSGGVPVPRQTAAAAGPGAVNWPGDVGTAVSSPGRRTGQPDSRPRAATTGPAANWPGDVRKAIAAGPAQRPAARPARRPHTQGQRRGLRP